MRSFKSVLIVPLVVLSFFFTSCDEDEDNEPTPDPQEVECFPESTEDQATSNPTGKYQATKTSEQMEIDGCSKEDVWMNQDWRNMNYKWLGFDVDSADYYGRSKLAWDEDRLYTLVEVVDDSLSPTLINGMKMVLTVFQSSVGMPMLVNLT